jgi:hypothetical protein
MYGMVNHGVQTFVTLHHGEGVWKEICASAGLNVEHFDTMRTYDDAVTYRLVGAVSARLDLPADKVLEAFGTYWTDYARDTAIGKLLDFGGSTFFQALESLDEMHERMLVAMPHLRPPSFEVEHAGPGCIRLHYQSHRPGLAPMVVGLLHGMAQQHGIKVDVVHAERKDDGADHDVFAITLVGAHHEGLATAAGAAG